MLGVLAGATDGACWLKLLSPADLLSTEKWPHCSTDSTGVSKCVEEMGLDSATYVDLNEGNQEDSMKALETLCRN